MYEIIENLDTETSDHLEVQCEKILEVFDNGSTVSDDEKLETFNNFLEALENVTYQEALLISEELIEQ